MDGKKPLFLIVHTLLRQMSSVNYFFLLNYEKGVLPFRFYVVIVDLVIIIFIIH